MKNFKILSIILGTICVFLIFACITTSLFSIKTAFENYKLEEEIKLLEEKGFGSFFSGASISFDDYSKKIGTPIRDIVNLYGLPHETALTFICSEVSIVQEIAPCYMTYGVSMNSDSNIRYVQFMYDRQKQPDGSSVEVVTEVYTFTSEEEYRAHLEKQHAEWLESLKK